MIQIVNDDIFNAFGHGCDAICHQVNCQGVMGAGLAKEIAMRWPEVKRDYKELCMEEEPSKLLGTYLDTPVEGGHIISIFGQNYYGRDNQCYTDYHALTWGFHRLDLAYWNRKIAIPYGIGCGLGGGDWSIVLQIIETQFINADVVIFRKG